MTKANKVQLKMIQTIFGGSIDYCKRNFRVGDNGKIVETFYDVRKQRTNDKVLHTLTR